MKEIFDTYERKARLYPMLLILSPLMAGALTIFPEWKLDAANLLPAVVVLAMAFLGTGLARDSGKKIESILFKEWGGTPTTQLLRHSDNTIDSATKERYHSTLLRVVPGLKLPNASQERNDAAAADVSYGSAANWLRDNTRDQKKFYLVFYENTSYGFRRNLLGLKNAALVSAVVGAIPPTYYLLHATQNTMRPEHIFSFAYCAIAFVVFAFIPNREFVRTAAFAYAIALLASCDTIAGKTPTKSSKPKPKA